MPSIYSVISSDPIRVDVLRDAVAAEAYGALVVFEGVVRNHDGGRAVTELEYQVHPDAQAFLDQIAQTLAQANPDTTIAIQHRFGLLTIGDVAFAAAVSSTHRDRAFEVCAEVVNVVKAELPIWKRQQFEDGTHEWVNFA